MFAFLNSTVWWKQSFTGSPHVTNCALDAARVARAGSGKRCSSQSSVQLQTYHAVSTLRSAATAPR